MSHSSRLEPIRSLRPALALAALIWAAGCSSTISVPDGRATPSSEPARRTDAAPNAAPTDLAATGGAASKPPPGKPNDPLSASNDAPVKEPPDDRACDELANAAGTMLTRYCADCHANGNAQGGFGDVLDVPSMIARALIVPGDPANSPVFALVDRGVMPQSASKPARNEIDTLGAWVECGAGDWVDGADEHPGFMSIDERLSIIRDDLDEQSSDDRESMRFIDLSQFANAGMRSSEIDAYRRAISLLLNSLSYADRIDAPEPVGRDGLLLRVDLGHYAWDAATWELITADYPYAVRYSDDDLEEQADEIRAQTGADIAYVQADWLLSHASRPPLYYDILAIPDDIDEFVGRFGVDIGDDVDQSDVARAGFNGSGISSNNRVIERHAQPDSAGTLWLSYDFRNSVDQRNVFAHPVDFQQDGGEGILDLPNGLQAYFLVDSTFTRLGKAPTEIVTDPNTRDRAVEAGLSCMGGCHLTRGIIAKADQIRDYVENSTASDDLIDRTRELYPDASTMQDHMDRDSERYRAALAATGFVAGDQTAIIRRVRTHDDLLDITAVASVLGVPVDDLQTALESRPEDFPLEIVTLHRPFATIYRNVLDQDFAALVSGLGLGDDPDPQDDAENADQ
jgi:mono/diheme cytochrome c family protein